MTTGTYRRYHFFKGRDRLEVLHRGLLRVAHDFGWQLEAWAVFSNHYHFVAKSPDSEEHAESLSPMLSLLHERTAKWVNKMDEASERKVWHNYRETYLSFERSYFARLAYTHQNPVKHGLVRVASAYPWCSAGWLEREGSTALIKSLESFKPNAVQVPDNYAPDSEW